jgi:hypothetical protein
MGPNQKPTDGLATLAVIAPISQGVGTATSGWVSLANYGRVLGEIAVGVFGASATVDAKFQQAKDGSGTGAKDITSKALTQLLAAGGNNVKAYINAADTDLDSVNGFSFVQLSITVGAAATLVAGEVKGFVPRYEPPVDSGANPAINLGSTAVVQIVG